MGVLSVSTGIPDIEDAIADRGRTDGAFAIAYAVLALTTAQNDTAIALQRIADALEHHVGLS